MTQTLKPTQPTCDVLPPVMDQEPEGHALGIVPMLMPELQASDLPSRKSLMLLALPTCVYRARQVAVDVVPVIWILLVSVSLWKLGKELTEMSS